MRKQIHVEERKDENFCDFSEIEDGKMTNKLQYYVRESERTLRVLHLMFVHANSPDRMSILLKASLYTQTLLTNAIVAQRINQGPDMSVARQIFLLESLYIQTLLTKGRLVLKESRMYWIARG